MNITPDLIALITTPFDPVEDAYKLKSFIKARYGFMKARYEDLIFFYLSTISNEWRQEVSAVFFRDFGRNLTKDLQSHLSKDYHNLITVAMMPQSIYQSMMLNYYLTGPGTDRELLLEILCTVSKPEIAEIAATYEIMYGSTLAENMASESDDFRRLLTHIVKRARYEHSHFEMDRAFDGVLLLLNEEPAMWGMEKGAFVKILDNESFAIIRKTFLMYKNVVGRSIEDVIKDELNGELKNAMTAIVNCIMDPTLWLARKLHGVMKGTDPDENAMVRIIVGRVEKDVVEINKAYYVQYNKTLQRAVVDFSEWRDICCCLGNATIRRIISFFYKPRNAVARKIANKISFFTIPLDEKL